jgi:hypothetical protein
MADPRTMPEDHDAQRNMEQRSLRNVRALLDRLEEEADLERRTRKRIGWALVIVAIVALAGAYLVAFHDARHGQGREIVLTPARP